MKRRISLALCLLMLLTAAGCGKTETPANETTPADTTANAQTETESVETEPEYPALPEKDMDGYDFHIDNYSDEWLSWAIHILTADETNGEAMNDEVWSRNNRIMEQFNCKITAELEKNPSDTLAEKILSGENTYKLVMIYDEQLVNHYAGGRLLTWDNIPYIDFTMDWWNENAGATFIANGKPFAATGDFSLSQSTRSFIMLFNKDMYADLGFADDLYTLVEEGKWTDDGRGSQRRWRDRSERPVRLCYGGQTLFWLARDRRRCQVHRPEREWGGGIRDSRQRVRAERTVHDPRKAQRKQYVPEGRKKYPRWQR